MLDEPLEEKPDITVDHEGYMEWLEQKLTYLKVEWMMCTFMNSGLRRAIDGVLRSLPPSFKNYVRDYVMGRDPITFYEFVSRLRHVKAEPIAGEVVNAEGIF